MKTLTPGMIPLNLTRRVVLLALALMLCLGTAQAIAAPQGSRAVQLTFLKSNPGQREQLKRFIVLNWFAMDKIAKDQSLMSAFTVMDTGTDEGAWNVLVSVTYTNEKGYAGVAEQFEKIRKAHTTVLVEGKNLRELGSIVDSKQLLEDPAHATR